MLTSLCIKAWRTKHYLHSLGFSHAIRSILGYLSTFTRHTCCLISGASTTSSFLQLPDCAISRGPVLCLYTCCSLCLKCPWKDSASCKAQLKYFLLLQSYLTSPVSSSPSSFGAQASSVTADITLCEMYQFTWLMTSPLLGDDFFNNKDFVLFVYTHTYTNMYVWIHTHIPIPALDLAQGLPRSMCPINIY